MYKFKLVKQGTAEWQRHAQPDCASGGGASGGGEPAAAAAAAAGAAADYVAPSFQGSLGKRKVRISTITSLLRDFGAVFPSASQRGIV